MNDKFTITISAVDKATAVIKKINKATSNITRPFEKISRASVSFGREIGNNPILAFAQNLTKKATGAAGALNKIISPLGAIGAVGTIAGITKLAESWGTAGINITNAASRVGMSAGSLQSFRGAATAAGLSADGMQGSLVALGDTLQGALYGRNPEAMNMLGQLGIKIKRSKDGVVDTAQAYSDLADAIQRNGNPQAQALIARTFGIEDQLPVLKKGSQGLREYQKLAREMGAVDAEATKSKERLGESWNKLHLSMEGVENRLAKGWLGKFMNVEMEGWTEIFSRYGGGERKSGGVETLPVDSDEGARIRALNDEIRDGGTGERVPGNGPRGIRPSLGIRNNNPMNLQIGGTEARFSNPAAGIEAGARNLLRGYQGLTIDQIANKYTPPNAPGNSIEATAAWAERASRAVGVDHNNVPDLTDARTLAPLISAIIKQENGKNPYSKDLVEQIAQKVTVEVHLKGNTSGVSATARSEGPNIAPPIIQYRMPSGVSS